MVIEELALTGPDFQVEVEVAEDGTPIRLLINYFTPAEVADRMVMLVQDPWKVKTILEPSAGTGRLIEAARRHLILKDAKVTCIENDDGLAQGLEEAGHDVIRMDFLKFPRVKKFDLILMSPPWLGDAGINHVAKAFEENLNPGGELVALMSLDVLTRVNDPIFRDFQSFYILPYCSHIQLLEKSTFSFAGHEERAIVIRLEKPAN